MVTISLKCYNKQITKYIFAFESLQLTSVPSVSKKNLTCNRGWPKITYAAPDWIN